MLNRFSFACRGLFVCCLVVLAAYCGCSAADSTSENGTALQRTPIIAKVGTVFRYTFFSRSTQTVSAPSGGYDDTVKSVDTNGQQVEELYLSSANANPRPVLDITSKQIGYSNAFLLSHLAEKMDDQPFSLPLGFGSYSVTRDTVLEANGFPVVTGTYAESTTSLGISSVAVGDTTFEVWKYMCVHDLSYTINSAVTESDTIWADFSPGLGYFTKLDEARFFRSGPSIEAYEIIASLASVSISK